MQSIRYMIWLVEQALGGFLYFWPVTLILAGLCLMTLVLAKSKDPTACQNGIKFMLLPFIGTVVTVLIGTAFHEKPEFANMPSIGAFMVLALSGFCIYKTKEIWPASLATSCLIIWGSFWGWFVSVMSVTGDWL